MFYCSIIDNCRNRALDNVVPARIPNLRQPVLSRLPRGLRSHRVVLRPVVPAWLPDGRQRVRAFIVRTRRRSPNAAPVRDRQPGQRVRSVRRLVVPDVQGGLSKLWQQLVRGIVSKRLGAIGLPGLHASQVRQRTWRAAASVIRRHSTIQAEKKSIQALFFYDRISCNVSCGCLDGHTYTTSVGVLVSSESRHMSAVRDVCHRTTAAAAVSAATVRWNMPPRLDAVSSRLVLFTAVDMRARRVRQLVRQ